MNIQEAKNEIERTVKAYLAKDEMGNYLIPEIRQRPVLLMGPPGIGKTQIMEQIASECKIGLVAYTITHHTRQSAVGLPFIKKEEFDGKEYDTTEYTMSEIIASIYRYTKETKISEGILFIDEINCVSETLAPTMLQFLQCKTFGNQPVPKGWIIVAAGNPPEYNRSVKEFDLVTLDRVRRMDIAPDYKVWKEYAKRQKMHPAILSYLEIKPTDFYKVESTLDGMQFVTARGWEDFSELLKAYEQLGYTVDEEIVYEYLRHHDVAEEVAAYLELYKKYEEDYQIPSILMGQVSSAIYERLLHAAFDERLSVVNLLLNGLTKAFSEYRQEKELTDAWYAFLKEYNKEVRESKEPVALFQKMLSDKKENYALLEKQGFLSKVAREVDRRLLAILSKEVPLGLSEPKECFEKEKAAFTLQTETLTQKEKQVGESLEHALDFMEAAFPNGQELVVFITELTIDESSTFYLSGHTCERYLEYSKTLLAGSRKRELLNELKR